MQARDKSPSKSPSSPLRELVVVVAFNGGLGLLETDVVEPCERGSVDVSDVVVGHQEQLLQQHIDNSVNKPLPASSKEE